MVATLEMAALVTALVAGFSLGFSLILAIGAQNAFVLRQGLLQSHVFWVCSVCAASDALLIVAGVGGVNVALNGAPGVVLALRYAGAAFLLGYGIRSFRSAWRGTGGLQAAGPGPESLSATLLTCLALTWLNPHVYLDTVLLIGSISTQYAGHTVAFGLGAALASVVFFFSLGYGARLLRPVFAKPAAWRWLDLAIGLVMLSIAAGLVL